MVRTYVRENVPLSRFGVLVAQLESIGASAVQQAPEPLLCFDLLSDLISAIDEEPKESILLWQRKCEDALQSLLTLGARRPVRHLASVAMARIISKGDGISIYSRVSSLQGFLSDGKRNEPQKVAGVAQCLGELYRHFGRKITSGLLETTIIATKLIKFHEEFVRQEALHMLQSALEGSGGSAASSAYTESFRLIMRFAVGDKSFIVRIAAARCLKAFASIGGPGLGVGELENSASYCVKALEDSVPSVRDAFAEALGSLLALGMNLDAQVQPRGKGPNVPAKKLEGGLQRYLTLPFRKASGSRSMDMRVGITLSWVFFLQTIRLKYLHPDSELQNFVLQVMDMLCPDASVDSHALACVLYILRVGMTDQMTEPTQRDFLVFLGKQLQLPDASPSMKIAALRTLSYTLKTLGEVPFEFKEMLDDTVVAAVSHSSHLVRIEAASTLRALAEVDPTCVGGLVSYVVTMLNALRENLSFEKGNNLQLNLNSLHGQATVLAAFVSISPKLPLGYPARLPITVLEVSKKMLTESSRNPVASIVEKEAGWYLLSSLLASMPREEIEDQVFDILSLWTDLFRGNPEHETKQSEDLISRIRMWSAAVDALTSFLKCFVSPNSVDSGILLHPILLYLSRALSYISAVSTKELRNLKPEMGIFIIRTLIAYQSLPDPMAYKNDHPQLIELCTTPFRDAVGIEESSCLRSLLDKRDAWLGPWVPGRDWFEDELRAFQGGKDGLMPCVWENELSSFPLPEPINKTLVNQMLLCFGLMFASQDSGGMLSLLGIIEQCLKSGKKQPWHAASVTNICVGLLAGFKALIFLRPQPLGQDILNSAHSIFQSILVEGDICASQRRASSEGFGFLARLGNDVFTARMTRLLLGDLTGVTDSNYAGSISLALGCIHRSAGGMALSTLVPSTVSSISLLAKSSVASLQIWSLHGLLLTVEAAGLSYVSHVQATLGLTLDILLSEENGWVALQQGVGRLINAIVAVLGPELAPGSIFFSRCKSVIAEISSGLETATMLENVRFTQQLVLFAPQAVSVHSHVQTLLPTLSSKQPTLRHLAVSTLRHLIEKDPVSIVEEQIEDELFHMLDEETDSEIGDLVRSTIMRLLYASCPSCPSHWISICRNVVLATSTRRNAEGNNDADSDPSNGTEGGTSLNFGHDDENMVSSSGGFSSHGNTPKASHMLLNRDRHLRYRTRVFAAECLSHLPTAVGTSPAHFDLHLARKQPASGRSSGDWLVLHIQELISLAYQISTIQFESMQPIGVRLLSTIMDKFEKTPDPELPGHLLLEQYQAQLVSAIRTALDSSSGPILLEAGLQLATKILTNGIIKGDQVAVKRIFTLISRPLNEFNDLYFPSFAEWVSCKIKIRLLAAHASLKCYTYTFLRKHHSVVPAEYLALLPLFSNSSNMLGKYWIGILRDYSYTFLNVHLKKKWNSFLSGIQSSLVSAKLQPCLEESWPLILQALVLDAVPVSLDGKDLSKGTVESVSGNSLLSGYNMVELETSEYQFLWGFSLLVLFRGQHSTACKLKIPLAYSKANHEVNSAIEELNSPGINLYEIVLPVFQFLSTKRFASAGFLTVDICRELMQVFSYSMYLDNSWDSLSISVLSQIVLNCPEDFLETENFSYLAMELCMAYLFKVSRSIDALSLDNLNLEDSVSALFVTAETLVKHFGPKKQLTSAAVSFLLIGYKWISKASTNSCFSKVNDFFKCTSLLLKKFIDEYKSADSDFPDMRVIFGICLNAIANLSKDCIQKIHLLENKSGLRTLWQAKLAFSLEQTILVAQLIDEIGCPGEHSDGDQVYFHMFKICIECIQNVLNDSNIQVQAIGLQVLKGVIQRGTNADDNVFLMFFAGELIEDIFMIIQKSLKHKLITKESAAVAGECLRLLVLLQAVSKDSECQRGYVKLFLEAIVMIIMASENGYSQEFNDLRSTAIRLVSQLAQIPSSAVHFKDALLSMPLAHRQQLQEVIRASVTQDQNATQSKATPQSLEIRLPVPTGESGEKISQCSAPVILDNKDSMVENKEDEEDEEDEDDWDAFQSFPASENAAGPDSKVESISKESIPTETETQTTDTAKDISDTEQEGVEEDVTSDTQGYNLPQYGSILPDEDEVEEAFDLKTNSELMEASDSQHYEREEEAVANQETGDEAQLNVVANRERRDEAEWSEASEQIPSDLGPNEDKEGSIEVNLVKDEQLKNEKLGNKSDAVAASSDPLPFDEEANEKPQTEADRDNTSEASGEAELQPESRNKL
ncbi:protein SWEETIE isoform X1 [Cannabis sativa]|uniref:protein SWEETIE isoform X1 n=1 Tax=Cannabis sativa TaxID=3483 RepID=UPI0029CA6D6B|nr:protein SWEETIE isoform X1 [Cannabis sativa]